MSVTLTFRNKQVEYDSKVLRYFTDLPFVNEIKLNSFEARTADLCFKLLCDWLDKWVENDPNDEIYAVHKLADQAVNEWDFDFISRVQTEYGWLIVSDLTDFVYHNRCEQLHALCSAKIATIANDKSSLELARYLVEDAKKNGRFDQVRVWQGCVDKFARRKKERTYVKKTKPITSSKKLKKLLKK